MVDNRKREDAKPVNYISLENDTVIHTWGELCEALYSESWKDHLKRYRTDFAFRGLPDKDHSLETTFQRNCGKQKSLEYHLLKNFRKYGQFNTSLSSEWHLITIAQHHSLPTRLLDWTYSPLIAAHFATVNTDLADKDGVIWMVDFVKVNHLLPEPMVDVLKSAGANAFSVELIEQAVPTLDYYRMISPEPQVMFFESPSIDERIINQYAFFSVMSDPLSRLDEWLSKHRDLFRRIIIPADLKWEIRDKLDQANITERILFPGLDGLAAWQKRYYRPRDV